MPVQIRLQDGAVVKTIGDTINFATIVQNTGTERQDFSLEHGFEGLGSETTVVSIDPDQEVSTGAVFTAASLGTFTAFARVFHGEQLLAELQKPNILEIVDEQIETGSIGGTVSYQGTPVQGVIVSYTGPASGSTSTDSTGFFQILNLPEGTYSISFSKTGFITQELDVLVFAGFQTPLDILLAAEQTGFTVTGRVTDSQSGMAIFQATLNFIGPTIKSVQTDFAGNYSVTDILPGSYNIQLSHPNYVDQTDSRFISETLNFHNFTMGLASGEIGGRVWGINLPPSPPSSLSGAIVTFEGPVSGATFTNSSGFYNLQLPVGNYSFKYSFNGFMLRELSVSVFAGSLQQDAFLDQGQTLDSLNRGLEFALFNDPFPPQDSGPRVFQFDPVPEQWFVSHLFDFNASNMWLTPSDWNWVFSQNGLPSPFV